MKKYLIMAVLLAGLSPAAAQNSLDDILASVERNNITLSALREQTEAEKLQNRTGLLLPDPEVEFGYLWGDPSSIGNRKDFSVTQQLDLATLFGARHRAADAQNGMLDAQYRAERMNILLQAKQTCLQLIYYNALHKELEMRVEHARTIATAYDEQLKHGNVNILEVNNARLSLSSAEGELRANEVERRNLLSQLRLLNGGEEVSFDQASFTNPQLPADFETWAEEAAKLNPAMAYVQQNIEVKRREMQLGKYSNLPQISAGYAAELVPGSNFRGVTMGISVPIWSTGNTIKSAKHAYAAAELQHQDAKLQFYENLKISYERTLGLQSIAADYRKALQESDNSELLRKSLDAGEISLLEYIVELQLYYTTVDATLAAERDYELALAELQAVTL
jgi:outer membrane protein, heavy metal efflux system